MGEGGVPWGEVVKVGLEVAKLLDSNTVVNTAQEVGAMPAGHSSFDGFTGWDGSPRQGSSIRLYASGDGWNLGGHEVGSCDFTMGVTFRAGGRLDGQGRFIKNANAYCSVVNIPLGHSYTIDAHWRDATLLDSGVAQLYCDFVVKHERLTLDWGSHTYRIFIQGDGASWHETVS